MKKLYYFVSAALCAACGGATESNPPDSCSAFLPDGVESQDSDGWCTFQAALVPGLCGSVGGCEVDDGVCAFERQNALVGAESVCNPRLLAKDFCGEDFSSADLTEADLAGANLSFADLSGARLIRANLRGANLSEANLTGADLTQADVTGVVYDAPVCTR